MRTLLFLTVLGLGIGNAAEVAAQKLIEQNVPVAAGQQVFLNLRQASSIRVHQGSGRTLAVKARVSINQGQLDDALLLSSSTTGNEVTVTSAYDEALLRTSKNAPCPDGHRTSWNTKGDDYYSICSQVDVDVTVPAGVTLRVSTISGNIDVTGVTGPLDLHAISGNINVLGAQGPLTAKSISGFVDVSWPAKQSADLRLKTMSGEVYTDQDIAYQTPPVKRSPVGYQLRGTLNGTGPLVQLESISGNVFLRKAK